MKLFIRNCNICDNKILIDFQAKTRADIIAHFGAKILNVRCGKCQNQSQYNVSRIEAESTSNATAGGAVSGGLIGLLGGPLGVFIGLLAGGAIGNASDNQEAEGVNRFNNS